MHIIARACRKKKNPTVYTSSLCLLGNILQLISAPWWMQKLRDHFHPECPFICSCNELINSHKGVWYVIIEGKNTWNRWKINAVVLGQGCKIGFHWAAGFCIDIHYFSLCLFTLVKLLLICPLCCSIELFNKNAIFNNYLCWVIVNTIFESTDTARS